MRISLVAAMANNRVIGKDKKMPWHLPAELKHFKNITYGKPIVMGRPTFESIGRPLPGRTNIVLTRQDIAAPALADGVVWVNGSEQAIAAAGPVEELMVIGGGKIYEIFLPRADRLYLTKIDLDVAGDTWFPDYNSGADWRLVEEHEHAADNLNEHSFKTLTFDRIS